MKTITCKIIDVRKSGKIIELDVQFSDGIDMLGETIVVPTESPDFETVKQNILKAKAEAFAKRDQLLDEMQGKVGEEMSFEIEI